jgi:hypothetical protein
MSDPEIHDGLIQAWQRQAVREMWIVIAMACVALATIAGLYLNVRGLEKENAKLRAMCDVQEQR